MGGDGWYGCDRSGGSACVIRGEVDMYCGMCEVEGVCMWRSSKEGRGGGAVAVVWWSVPRDHACLCVP